MYDLYLNDNHKVTNKPAVCKQNLAAQKQHLEERTDSFLCPNKKNPLSFSSEKAASSVRLLHCKCSITDAKLIKSGKEQ